MYKKIAAFFTLLVMALFMLFVATAPASAHTPAIQVTCEGVKLHATNYDGNAANTWTVSLDGVVTSGTFGSSLDKVIPVPQEGKTTTVGAQIADVNQTPEWSSAFSGAVGPCGEKPVVVVPPVEEPPAVVVPEKPAPVVTRVTEVDIDCNNQRYSTYTTITTTDWVLVNNVWVAGTPVVTYEDTIREVTPEECPALVTPPADKPEEPATTPETPVKDVETPVAAPEKPSEAVSTPVGTDVPVLAVAPAAQLEQTAIKEEAKQVVPVSSNVETLAQTGFNGGWVALGASLAVIIALLLIGISRKRDKHEFVEVDESK